MLLILISILISLLILRLLYQLSCFFLIRYSNSASFSLPMFESSCDSRSIILSPYFPYFGHLSERLICSDFLFFIVHFPFVVPPKIWAKSFLLSCPSIRLLFSAIHFDDLIFACSGLLHCSHRRTTFNALVVRSSANVVQQNSLNQFGQ